MPSELRPFLEYPVLISDLRKSLDFDLPELLLSEERSDREVLRLRS